MELRQTRTSSWPWTCRESRSRQIAGRERAETPETVERVKTSEGAEKDRDGVEMLEIKEIPQKVD